MARSKTGIRKKLKNKLEQNHKESRYKLKPAEDSPLREWIEEKGFDRRYVCLELDIPFNAYDEAFLYPSYYFTVEHLKKLSWMTEKPFWVVLFACYPDKVNAEWVQKKWYDITDEDVDKPVVAEKLFY